MMDEKHILERIDRIREIPTLPSMVFELNKLLQDPDNSVARISQTIEKDQATALKILKLVNSAFYGLQSKVSDIRSAVIMLGFNAVRNAIISVSVIEAFNSKIKLPDFNFTDFWKHSLAVAVTSKSIAYSTRLNSPDNCFVGGLLHDVGKVIMAQYFREMFASVWNTSKSDAISFYEAEQKLTLTNHAVLGAHLASRWQLPPGLSEAIRLHHDRQFESQDAEVALIIHLANVIVNSYNDDPECVINFSALHPEARKLVMGALKNVADFYLSVAEEIEAAYAFFLPSHT